jgi:DNA-binding response OmpR family regulator
MAGTSPRDGTQPLPGVLLVEDDASLRRFVAMALEDMPLDLVQCGSVEEAWGVLPGRPFRLVITDLMLPGAHGHVLLQHLADVPAQDRPLMAVFSAGLDAAMVLRLRELGVWRILPKPISLRELEACVQEALRMPAWEALDDTALDPSAVTRHFGGNAALHAAFLSTCLVQFGCDVEVGDAACQQGDEAALHRMAHSLKTVLSTLGFDALGQQAAALERSAGTGDKAAALSGWPTLSAGLRALVARHARGP